MHYLNYVMIDNTGNIEGQVARALFPFDEDLKVESYRRYLDPGEIEAMAQHYGLRPDETTELAARMHDWRREPGGVGDGGLFSLSEINPEGKWDWYEIGGRWNNLIPGNVATAGDLARKLTKKLLPHALVTLEGCWLECETLHVDGWAKFHVDRLTDRQWRAELRRQLRLNPNVMVVAVDCHR